MCQENYPSEMYRGIPSKDFIKSNLVMIEAFQPDPIRDDGYREISINWNDDEGALKNLFSKKKEANQEYQFIFATKLDLERVKDYLRDHIANENLKYERSPIPENKYHGNILILGKDKQMQQLIRANLAIIAGTNIIPNNNINCLNK